MQVFRALQVLVLFTFTIFVHSETEQSSNNTPDVASKGLDPAAEIQPDKISDSTRKKKSTTTTLCVEIRPSGPYQHPYQICEPANSHPYGSDPAAPPIQGYYSAPTDEEAEQAVTVNSIAAAAHSSSYDLVYRSQDGRGEHSAEQEDHMREVGDEYGSPVTYIQPVVKRKPKKGHNAVVITCQPSLAGYAATLPNGYGGSYGGSYTSAYGRYDESSPSGGCNYGSVPVYGASMYEVPGWSYSYKSPVSSAVYSASSYEPAPVYTAPVPIYKAPSPPSSSYGVPASSYSASVYKPSPVHSTATSAPEYKPVSPYSGSSAAYTFAPAQIATAPVPEYRPAPVYSAPAYSVPAYIATAPPSAYAAPPPQPALSYSVASASYTSYGNPTPTQSYSSPPTSYGTPPSAPAPFYASSPLPPPPPTYEAASSYSPSPKPHPVYTSSDSPATVGGYSTTPAYRTAEQPILVEPTTHATPTHKPPILVEPSTRGAPSQDDKEAQTIRKMIELAELREVESKNNNVESATKKELGEKIKDLSDI